MADLVITAASVLAGANSKTSSGLAGEAIAAGKAVYFDTATSRFKLGDSNAVAAAPKALTSGGIALNTAATDQPLVVHREGDVTAGAALTPGAAYYLSDTPGGICPLADVGSGENVTLIGIAKSATVLAVDIQPSGVAL